MRLGQSVALQLPDPESSSSEFSISISGSAKDGKWEISQISQTTSGKTVKFRPSVLGPLVLQRVKLEFLNLGFLLQEEEGSPQP
jgi:hypothetical protein